MRSSNLRLNVTGSALKKAAIAVAFAAVVSALPLKVALADNDDRRDNRQHQNQGRHDNEGRRRHYRYPVYVPPPIYRPRYESPGIRLIIPIEIR